MKQYIDRAAVMAEIEKRIKEIEEIGTYLSPKGILTNLLCYINALEVIDPYEQCVQYDSIKAGIQAHAETYSFNIESELFNQLTTEEQQALWRKEIEQACVSGGEVGVELARDPRYKENIKVKDVDLNKKIKDYFDNQPIITRSKGVDYRLIPTGVDIAKHFFELGLKAEQKFAWNEEDEKTLNEIFSVAARASLRKSTLFGKSYDYIKWQNWLKSLRDRVQPKKEWSEEDDYMLESIISDFAAGHISSIGQDKWLKSIKQRIGG